MTNEERRTALNLARQNALAAAQEMDVATEVPPHFRAAVWAHVANALKDGDPVHDAPDGAPIDPYAQQWLTNGTETR